MAVAPVGSNPAEIPLPRGWWQEDSDQRSDLVRQLPGPRWLLGQLCLRATLAHLAERMYSYGIFQ
jgi:hypothetical protein